VALLKVGAAELFSLSDLGWVCVCVCVCVCVHKGAHACIHRVQQGCWFWGQCHRVVENQLSWSSGYNGLALNVLGPLVAKLTLLGFETPGRLVLRPLWYIPSVISLSFAGMVILGLEAT
jgi:hypothetical protein